MCVCFSCVNFRRLFEASKQITTTIATHTPTNKQTNKEKKNTSTRKTTKSRLLVMLYRNVKRLNFGWVERDLAQKLAITALNHDHTHNLQNRIDFVVAVSGFFFHSFQFRQFVCFVFRFFELIEYASMCSHLIACFQLGYFVCVVCDEMWLKCFMSLWNIIRFT